MATSCISTNMATYCITTNMATYRNYTNMATCLDQFLVHGWVDLVLALPAFI